MNDTLIFRLGMPQDRPALRPLALAAYGTYTPVLSPPDWQGLESFLQKDETWDFLLDRSTFFVCEENGVVAGMAFVLPKGNPGRLFEAEWAQLRMVGVHPAAAGKGIGKRLTQMAIDHARHSGEKTLALHTTEFMGAARHLYESLGFTVYRELEPLYGMRNWVYTLDL